MRSLNALVSMALAEYGIPGHKPKRQFNKHGITFTVDRRACGNGRYFAHAQNEAGPLFDCFRIRISLLFFSLYLFQCPTG
jgi:hypothetical protein